MENVLGPGTRIDDYEILDRLGAGGMGEVYRARDTRLGRTVAIKVLRPGADPELLRRLDREARAASALNHPHIVQIYDVGDAPGDSGAHYVVMEHVEGETLRRHLAAGALPMAELLDLGAQVADGLARAHRAGIVHRDLKPENVMVTPEGRAKILDFGLAKMTAPLADIETGTTVSRYGTKVGTLMGTLEYMSPEQATGRPVDHRTDQFSLGLILHEMATGRPCFRRDTPAQVLAAVIERDPEPLDRLRPDAPAELCALVARCLQKDPQKRFPTTDELAAELRALAGRARTQTAAGGPVSVEVLPSPRPAPRRRPVYHLQEGDKVRTYEEDDLAERIREGKLSGMELVRREDEERWVSLFETRVYRLEVPNAGDAGAVARSRSLRALFGHFSGFFITGVVMYSTQGHLPFWMAIWGAVLAMQVLGSAPALWSLWRRHRATVLPAPEPALPAAVLAALPAPPAPVSPAAQEVERVRALIQQRGGKDAPRLIAEVDNILRLTADLAARQADLEEQTSEPERAALAAAIEEARARVARAELPEDQRLFERKLEVLQAHEEAIGKAMRVLERLRVRRELAAHQLKQLRLDLSRGAASGLDVPELSSRLQFIRYEVDAREEVEQIAMEGK